jgi:hypothetical protein
LCEVARAPSYSAGRYAPEAVAALKARGVIFEEYELPRLKTVNGIAKIAGNYPSKGVGEKGS